ncbi:DNA polymerase IV [Sphingobacteriaceae bacterium AH-315-L07]|nr:DNA polymerase IV [Sphingobacteriaceae bacterium AH-315-L07]
MDLDSFFVSCEQLINPQLKNRPVLIGGTSDRGVVASCSYEAREYGIHSAMPMRMARQLCPHAVVLQGNSGTYSKYSDMVTDIIAERAPLYEKSSIDEFYIDISGMDKFFGCYKWSKELRTAIMEETGLPISFGLSTNKTVAKVGTGEVKPNNYREIPKGEEKMFLAPLSIKKIPMVGDQTYKLLRGMGIEYIQTIQQMQVELMDRLLGKSGITIWKKSNGIDNTPVISYQERKSISLERTFERDTINMVKLKSIIVAMAENLAYQLRKGDKLTSCIAVKIRYSDFNTHTKQLKIPYTSCDHTLIERIVELFNQLYNKRMLIRLIGVRYSHLISGAYQINLFEDDHDMIKLYQQMDWIRNRFGQDAVKRAIAMGSKGIGTFGNPFDGRPPIIPAHRRA